MSWYRWLLCAVLLVLVDGSWLSLLLAWMAFLAGIHGGLLSWAVCQALLVVTLLVAATGEILPQSWRIARVCLSAVGGIVVWLAVAGVTVGGGDELGVRWPLALALGDMQFARAAATALALVTGFYLWRHAVRRARAPAGNAQFARSFRIGLLVFVLILSFEAAGDLDLGSRAALVPFFLASLCGMALARAPTHGTVARAWSVLVAIAVAAALGLGGVLAVVGVVMVQHGLGAVQAIWLELVNAVVTSVSVGLTALPGTGAESAWDMGARSPDVPQALVLLVLLAGAALFGYLAQRLLRAPVARWPEAAMDPGREEHEALGAGESVGLGSLVEFLTGIRRRRSAAGDEVLDRILDPRRKEIFRLYYQLLRLARQRGIRLDPAHTPYERAARLRHELPGAPVDSLTRCFVEACYADRASTPEAIADLQRALAVAMQGKR